MIPTIPSPPPQSHPILISKSIFGSAEDFFCKYGLNRYFCTENDRCGCSPLCAMRAGMSWTRILCCIAVATALQQRCNSVATALQQRYNSVKTTLQQRCNSENAASMGNRAPARSLLSTGEIFANFPGIRLEMPSQTRRFSWENNSAGNHPGGLAGGMVMLFMK